MYLDEQQRRTLSELLLVLAEPHEEQDIRAQVGYLLLTLLKADHYASYVWNPQSNQFEQGVSLEMSQDNLHTYETYYQFNDPITHQLQQHHEPVLVSQVLAQDALVKTEFFNDFLRKDGLYWGVNLYAWSEGKNIGDMRIWRGRHRDNFDQNELQILELIKPLFIAALKKCQPALSGAGAALRTVGMHASPISNLSEREREIAALIAQGMADKQIARELTISHTTVRTHINHVFEKLQIDSRCKLIALMQGSMPLLQRALSSQSSGV